MVTGDIDLMDLLVRGDAGPDLRKIQLVAADLDGGLEGRWVGGAHRPVLGSLEDEEQEAQEGPRG